MLESSTGAKISSKSWSILLVLCLALLASVSLSSPAFAAEISGAIKKASLTVTVGVDGKPVVGRTQSIHIDWCVPNGTKEGDYFKLLLPKEIQNNSPLSFNLLDPATKAVVAVANLTDPTPNHLEYTFTFTSYAATHFNTCGVADFTGRLDIKTPVDVTIPLVFTENAGAANQVKFTQNIVATNPVPIDFSAGRKDGTFTRVDQGRVNPTDALLWVLYSPPGPLTNFKITDNTSNPSIQFDCSSLKVIIGHQSPDPATGYSFVGEGLYTGQKTVNCTPTSFDVTVPNVADGKLISIEVNGSFLVPLGQSTPPITITNAAQMTWTKNGSTQSARPSTRVVQASGSGSGQGDTPVPNVTIVKKDTAGNDADTVATAATLGQAPGSTDLVYTITNSGTEPLINLEVTDVANSNGTVSDLSCDFSPLGGPETGTTWSGPLDVGDSFACTAALKNVTANGVHTNTGTIKAAGAYSTTPVTDSNAYNATVENPVPGITITKDDEAGNSGDDAEAPVKLATDSTHLVYTVTNNGKEALKGITVTDEVTSGTAKVENLTCDFSPLGGPTDGVTWDGPLKVGDTFTCTADLTGVLAGEKHSDIGRVVATGVISDTVVTDENPYHAVLTEQPSVTIVKKDAAGNDANDEETAVTAQPNTPTDLVFTITNNGDEALENIEVTDVVTSGDATLPQGFYCRFPDGVGGSIWSGPFEPGESFTCTGTLSPIKPGQLHTDVATVTGVGVTSNKTVTANDPYNAKVAATTPEISIIKEDIDGNNADTEGEAAILSPEGTTNLVFTIGNTGDEPLKNLTVTDVVRSNGTVEDFECAFPGGAKGTTWAGPLPVGSVIVCTARLTGVTPGSLHLDEASVTAVGELSGTEVKADNPYYAKVEETSTPTTPPTTTPVPTPTTPSTSTPSGTSTGSPSATPSTPAKTSPTPSSTKSATAPTKIKTGDPGNGSRNMGLMIAGLMLLLTAGAFGGLAVRNAQRGKRSH